MRVFYVSTCAFGKRIRRRFAALLSDDSGATAVEYGLIIAGMSVLILVAVFNLGDELEGIFTHLQTTTANAIPS